MTMLDAVKLAMMITVSDYDDELQSLIDAGLQDLRTAGIRADEGDALIRRAVITYCRMYFGTPPDYDKVAAAYELQKATLMHANGYTDWGCSR